MPQIVAIVCGALLALVSVFFLGRCTKMPPPAPSYGEVIRTKAEEERQTLRETEDAQRSLDELRREQSRALEESVRQRAREADEAKRVLERLAPQAGVRSQATQPVVQTTPAPAITTPVVTTPQTTSVGLADANTRLRRIFAGPRSKVPLPGNRFGDMTQINEPVTIEKGDGTTMVVTGAWVFIPRDLEAFFAAPRGGKNVLPSLSPQGGTAVWAPELQRHVFVQQ
jgi:hypothetical protein